MRQRHVHLFGLATILDQLPGVVDVIGAQRQSERANNRHRQQRLRRQRFNQVARTWWHVKDEVVLVVPVGQVPENILALADLVRRVLARPVPPAARLAVQTVASRRPHIRLTKHPKHRATMASGALPSVSGSGCTTTVGASIAGPLGGAPVSLSVKPMRFPNASTSLHT